MTYRKTKIALIVSVLCSIFVLFSYINARNIADEVMQNFLEGELYYYGTSFHPVQFHYENNEITKWWGPSWYVSFDTKTIMITQPYSIRVNLFGKITATNPNNLNR